MYICEECDYEFDDQEDMYSYDGRLVCQDCYCGLKVRYDDTWIGDFD